MGRIFDSLEEYIDRVYDLALSGDGQVLVMVSAHSGRTLKVWDMVSAQELHSMNGHTGQDSWSLP